MKKVIAALLIIAAMATMLGVGTAALNYTQALNAARSLDHLGLFKGTGVDTDGNPNYDLGNTLTREQAIAMVVRLLGKEDEALEGVWDIPFEDVSKWAKPYVGYAYANGLTSGIGQTAFGGNTAVSASQYITFMLRLLGYSSEYDFEWNKSWDYAVTVGLCEQGQYSQTNDTDFKRGDAVIISYKAIGIPHRQTGERIIEPIYSEAIASEASAFTIDELAKDISTQRKQMYSEEIDYSEINKLVPNNSDVRSLLTYAEIKSLATPRARKNITYEQAIEDVDLYFRSYKYAYGAYYYFGDEVFDELKAKVVSELEGKQTVKSSELSDILVRNISTLRDGHLGRVGVDRYEYRCTEGQSFFKDSKGYYKMIDGEKWYYDGASDEHVTMELSLTANGALVYSPVWFYYDSAKISECEIYLRSGRESMSETVSFKEGVSYSTASDSLDYEFFKENKIAYVSIRNFNRTLGASAFEGFLESATQLNDVDTVILDLRSHGGGTDHYPREWIKRFAGVDGVYYRARYVTRRNALVGNVPIGEETIVATGSKGVIIPNDKLFIILTDDKCGSAGEIGVQLMKTLDNSVVIGGPTAGRVFCCGSLPRFYLPNSGVSYSFGTGVFCFDNEMNNDDIGMRPDIWCDPQFALDAVLMLLVREGKISAADAWGLNDTSH